MGVRRSARAGGFLFAVGAAATYAASAVGMGLVIAAVGGSAGPLPGFDAANAYDGAPAPKRHGEGEVAICHREANGTMREIHAVSGSDDERRWRQPGDWWIRIQPGQTNACRLSPTPAPEPPLAPEPRHVPVAKGPPHPVPAKTSHPQGRSPGAGQGHGLALGHDMEKEPKADGKDNRDEEKREAKEAKKKAKAKPKESHRHRSRG